ncbi:MAG: ABC transporter permease [Chloroflexota bacterium]|nr:ABC transporter permease [Chloroflexota bacterium]
MDTLQKALQYALDPRNDLLEKVWAHVLLSGAALLLAVAIGVPLGIWISQFGAFARITVNFAGVLRVVPSIAVLFLLLPLVGTGFRPSLIALTFLAVPPILINTDAGMRSVAPAIIEAGRGLGMSAWRLLWRVQIPLALPVVLGGLRRAAVEVIASATLATLIGGGGLGDYIQAGLALSRNDILLVGAIPVALLALTAELGLNYAERAMTRQRA